MNILTLFINILCLKCCVSIFHPNNELQMIVDVVNSYEKPTTVAAKVCWESLTIEIKLARMLANLKTPINIRYLRENETLIKIQSYPNNHHLFLLDKNCEDAEIFLKQASANKMFSKSYRWLVLGNPIQYNGIIGPEFEDLIISIDSEVIIAQENENKDVLLHAIYKLRAHNEWNTEYYGIWSADYGLNKSEDRIHSNLLKRKDFKGEPLTTSVVISDNRTKTDLLELSNIFVDTLAKSSFRCIDPVYDFLNASRVIIFTETWGYLTNGTWKGMIGDIQRGRADLCGREISRIFKTLPPPALISMYLECLAAISVFTFFLAIIIIFHDIYVTIRTLPYCAVLNLPGVVTYITIERMPILEYLIIPSPISAKFVFRQPPLSYQNNLFILPFTTSVWVCAAAFVLIVTAILYINTKWDKKKYEKYKKQKMNQTCLEPTWSDTTIFVISAISQQGSTNELKGTLGRLVMFIVFLAFLFLYTSYSAYIVALLQSTSNQIRTLSDLLHSKLELGVEDVAYNRYYFSAAKDPIRKAIFETKVAPRGKPNFMSLEDGVKAMQKRPFAFHMNTGIGYRMVSAFFHEHEKCGLQEIDYLQHDKPWLCSRRNSPFAEMFKIGYIRILEHGLTDRENRLIYAKKPVCSARGGSFDSVNMVDFYPVCLMLLYGIFLAFVLLGVEILVHRRQGRESSQSEI